MSEFCIGRIVGLRQIQDGGNLRMEVGQIGSQFGTTLNCSYHGFDEKQAAENDAK